MAIQYLDAKRIRGASTSVFFDSQAHANTASDGTTLTVDITIGNNDNRILIVSAGSYNASPTISGVTFGSQNFTAIDDDIIGSDGRSYLWYLLAPVVGTDTITVTWSGTAGRKGIGGMSFYNVAQTAPVNANTESSTSGTTAGGDVTPTTAGSIIVDGMFDISGSSSRTGNKTAGWTNFIGGSDRGQSSQYDLSPTIGSANAMNYTLGSGAGWAWVGCEVKAFGSVDATKASLVTAGIPADTGVYGGDASEYTQSQGDSGGSGSAGFSIATGQGGLAGNSAVINSANRDWNNSFNFVTHGGVSAIDSTTSFVMEFDMFRASDDGSADQVADHTCFYLDTTGTGADPNVGNSGAWITFGWVNYDENYFKIYCKNSSGTAYNGKYQDDEHDIQPRNTTKYYRATFNETGYTDKIRLYMYPTAVARTNDAYGSGTYAGTGATFVGTGDVFTGGATGKQAWADADAFTNFTMVTYNSLNKHFATKNVKFWNDTVDNTGTPELNLTFDARADTPASSDLPENTLFEETDTYKSYFLQSSVWKLARGLTLLDDDFSSDNWTQGGGTYFDVANNQIEFTIANDDDRLTWDIVGDGGLTTADISDNWVLRIKDVKFSTFKQYGNLYIGVSNQTSGAANTTQDFIGLRLNDDSASGANDIFFNPLIVDSAAPNASGTANGTDRTEWRTGAYDTSTNGAVPTRSFYFEVIRSGNSLTINASKNADFSSPFTTKTITGANTLTGLRYIKLMAVDNSSNVPAGDKFIGTIQGVEFYNGS